MKLDYKFAIFMACFHVIYFGMHYFIFSFFKKAFGFTGFPWIILIIATLSYAFTLIIEKKWSFKLGKYLHIVSVIWFGFIWILFSLVLIGKIINIFYPNKYIIALLAISISIILSIYAVINALFTKITRLDLKIPNLKKELRVVQLSDLHLGTIKSEKFFKKIVKKTNSLNPDIVVITGDLVDGSAPLNKKMILPLNEIKSPVFYVIGNHEIYEGVDKVIKILKNTKATILRNKKANYKDLQIIGIDHSDNKDYVFQQLKRIKYSKDKLSLLLFHPPTDLKRLNENKIDLHLAGHTHGGQVFPFQIFVKMAFKYIKGLHKFGRSKQYISTGTSTWGPPMRLGSKNEIVIIDLKPN